MKLLLPTVSLALAASLPVLADVKINDNLTVSGYVAGAYTSFSPSPGVSSDSLFDAAKAPPGAGDANAVDLTFTATFKPVTAVVSLFEFPSSASNAVGLNALDAYVTYDAGGGLTITGGKFLSYLGYESFYPTLMSQISYANGDFLGAIVKEYVEGGISRPKAEELLGRTIKDQFEIKDTLDDADAVRDSHSEV